MSLPQQATTPWPCFVHRTSVLQVSQLYLLPSVFAIPVQTSYLESCLDAEHLAQQARRQIEAAAGHADGCPYFFRVIGCPQQLSSPCPARVTMNSEPHLAQVYLLPT